MLSVAYFITPHGFGHASRASAVMATLAGLIPGIRFELFTTCPRWIFEDSVGSNFGYHAVQTDIGIVQASPLLEDLQATCLELERMLPFNEAKVLDLSELLDTAKEMGVRLIGCQMSMDVLHIKPEELIDGIEIGGAATFLEYASEDAIALAF